MEMFAREGATVFGVARTQANLDETLKLVKDAGGEGDVFSADLSDPDQAEASVNRILSRPRTRGNHSPLLRRGVLEEAIETDYTVEGGARLLLEVEPS